MRMAKVDPTMFYVIYDMDDILHPYAEAIAQNCGVELSTWQHFYAPDNGWPDDVVARVNQEFYNPKYFRDIKFFPGIKDILRPHQELGINVGINTNGITDEIEALKREVLMAAVPKLTDEMIVVNRNLLNQVCDKTLPPRTLIYVEDNPHHVIKSTAELNLIRTWPWNTSEAARQILKPVRRYVYQDDLQEINSFIYWHIKRYLETTT